MRRRRRSRRRRGSRACEVLMAWMAVTAILLAATCLVLFGIYGARYVKAAQTSKEPLESSREVVPEEMPPRKQQNTG